MSKEEMHEILLGVAVVALAYAFMKHAKAVPKVPAVFANKSPIYAAPGTPYDPANPAQFVTVKDLLNGSVHDIITGDTSSSAIPTVNDIIGSTIDSGPTYNEQRGFVSQDSVVRNPNAYW
jgi:hypothetical protein